MRILSRYLVARFIALFFATLLTSTLAIVIVEMLLNFDDMMKVEQGAVGVLTYLVLRIPSYYLRDLVPLAVFAGMFFSLGTAARSFELTAIKAGGISPKRAAVPVLIAASVVAVLAFLVNETWVVQATRQWEQQRAGATQALDFRSGSFWYHRGRTIYNISGADRASRTLERVHLFERDDGGRLVRSIEAKSVRIDDDHLWHFEHATIRSFRPDDPSVPPVLDVADHTALRFGKMQEEALMGANASILSVPRLREYIASRTREGAKVDRLVADLHSRLAEPAGVVILALLAIPFALRVEHTRSMGRPAVFGVVAVAVFFLVRGVGTTLAAEGVLPPALVPWFIVILFGALGAWSFYRTAS